MDLPKKQNALVKLPLVVKNISERINGTEINVGAFSVYDLEECQPMTREEASLNATMLSEVFNIPEVKAVFIAEILFEERWSNEKLRDAVKHVIKTNIYATGNIGIEPAKILSYDKLCKFYTYTEMLEFDTGGTGFKRVRIPGLPNNSPRCNYKEVPWWVQISDTTPFPDWEE